MDYATIAAIGSLAISGSALLLSGLQSRKSDGKELGDVESRITNLERRADAMKTELNDMTKAVAVLPELNTKLTALDRLVTFRLDRVDETMKGVVERLDWMIKPPAHHRPPS